MAATPNVWFTSDTHFKHRAMIERGWRPRFSSLEEMDQTMIENWNAVVRPNDIVWHLGDVGMGTANGFLPYFKFRLNGTKHLIAGNHDKPWSGNRDAHSHLPRWLDGAFASVQTFAKRHVGGKTVMLSHFPYAGDHVGEDRYNQFRLRDEGPWLIHGHVHGAWRVKGRMINVGVDVWNFRPVPLSEIERIIHSADLTADMANIRQQVKRENRIVHIDLGRFLRRWKR